jgi:hypothetical protein
MQADFRWDDDSPRFALHSLWFLLGVIVFAFTVLVMATIVSGAGSDGAYLDAPPRQLQSVKPATGTAAGQVTTSSTAPQRPGAARQTTGGAR